MVVLGCLFQLFPVLHGFKRRFPLFFSELVALSHTSFSPEHFNLCHGKRGGFLILILHFVFNHEHLHFGCNVNYGALYLRHDICDENAFCITLRIPVFPHTAVQCCMDSTLFAFISINNNVSFFYFIPYCCAIPPSNLKLRRNGIRALWW